MADKSMLPGINKKLQGPHVLQAGKSYFLLAAKYEPMKLWYKSSV